MSPMAEADTVETPRSGGLGHVAPLTSEPVALAILATAIRRPTSCR
jgi:hypothetical protein